MIDSAFEWFRLDFLCKRWIAPMPNRNISKSARSLDSSLVLNLFSMVRALPPSLPVSHSLCIASRSQTETVAYMHRECFGPREGRTNGRTHGESPPCSRSLAFSFPLRYVIPLFSPLLSRSPFVSRSNAIFPLLKKTAGKKMNFIDISSLYVNV